MKANKVRVWCENENVFVNPAEHLRISSFGQIIPIRDNLKIDLFSGIIDKNGIEIFENDIVKYTFFQDYLSDIDEYVECIIKKIGIVKEHRSMWHFFGEDYTPTLNNICIKDFIVLGNDHQLKGWIL